MRSCSQIRSYDCNCVYTACMRNSMLTIGYFVALGIVVASRDRFLDNDTMVFIVAAVALFAGLALWVLIAQGRR